MTDECNICGLTTKKGNDDELLFGEWMRRNGITVHYFCLLFSTNLPQKGQDANGILGFLLRDIRAEINNAVKRICIYCHKKRAHIACYKCKEYYHMVCGRQYECTFEFIDEFRSFCRECAPLDEYQKRFLKEPPIGAECYICTNSMLGYHPTTWIHARCCGKGFVHRLCMQKFALAAGYYLVCIWCRSKDFRDHVRLQGVFVPNRDAEWEKNNAFAELHRGYRRCDIEDCKCPKGRCYSSGKWTITICSLCGSFGAHIPGCIPGSRNKTLKNGSFKCKVCCEATIKSLSSELPDGSCTNYACTEINPSLLVTKKICNNRNEDLIHETPQFSQIETSCDYSQKSPDLDQTDTVLSTSQLVERDMDEIGPTTKETVAVNERDQLIVDLCSTSQTLGEQILSSRIYIKERGNNNDHRAQKRRASQENNTDNIEADFLILRNCPQIDDTFNCTGTFTARINLNSPRFVGKSFDEICTPEIISLLKDEDIIERSSDTGLFGEIDNIINEVLECNEMDEASSISNCYQDPLCQLNDIESTSSNNAIPDKEMNNLISRAMDQNTTLESLQSLTSNKSLPSNGNDKEQIEEKESGTIGRDYANDIETKYMSIKEWPLFDDSFKCVGTCTVRINLNSPRFAGKTFDEICAPENMSIITEEDIVEKSDNTGIFGEIDNFIEAVVSGCQSEEECRIELNKIIARRFKK